MSTLKTTNIAHPSSASNNIVLDASGNVNIDSNTLYVDATNNRVGIGTTAVAAKLNVATNDLGITPSVDADELLLESSGHTGMTILCGTGQRNSIFFGESPTGSTSGAIIYDASNDSLRFATNGAANERFRVDNTGRLLVGTTSASVLGGSAIGLGSTSSTNAEFVMKSADTGVNALYFGDSGSSFAGYIEYSHVNNNLKFGTNGILRLTIANDGTFTGSASNDISDQRLKHNIQVIADPVEKIKSLTGRTFEWKPEANMQPGIKYGFVAQEIEAVVPELVESSTGVRMIGSDGNIISDHHEINQPFEYAKSVQSSGVLPILVEALKEALAKIETLEAKVAALEAA